MGEIVPMRSAVSVFYLTVEDTFLHKTAIQSNNLIVRTIRSGVP